MSGFLTHLMARPIAHRGLHDRPNGVIENSSGAFLAATHRGFGIECDVQLTRDGEAVVFHDYDLDRLTGDKGRIDSRTAAELSKIGLTGSGSGDTIGTLTDMLALVDGRVPIVVEIKSRFDGDLRLTRRVAEVLSAFPTHPVCVESFDPRIVTALRMVLPDHPRGIVAMGQYEYPDYETISSAEKHAMANLLHFNEMQPDFLSWQVKDLPSAAPFLARSALGLPVSAWTVRTAEDIVKSSAHADQMVFEGFIPD